MSKRRFFQMHLSTAVVLMLVAGVLVWANVQEGISEEDFPTHVDAWKIDSYYGWPFTLADKRSKFSMSLLKNVGIVNWYIHEFIYNSLIALAILLAVWQLCEWRIRRRSSQKSP